MKTKQDITLKRTINQYQDTVETSAVEEWVNIKDIIIEPSFQSTGRCDLGLVKELEGKYRAGVNVQPIELAEVKGQKILINGWHRLEAQKHIEDVYEVKAVVTSMTMFEATKAAIKANTDNGKQLTNAQKIEKIEWLYTHRMYKDEFGRPRTFEDMAKDINSIKTAKQISKWIEKHHLKTYKWMKQNSPRSKEFQEVDTHKSRGGGLRDKRIVLPESTENLLKRVKLVFNNSDTKSDKEDIASRVREMAERMEKDVEDCPEDEF